MGVLWDGEPEVKIYGEIRCRDFAKRLKAGKPNTEVIANGRMVLA
jgi:hypothetical protein